MKEIFRITLMQPNFKKENGERFMFHFDSKESAESILNLLDNTYKGRISFTWLLEVLPVHNAESAATEILDTLAGKN